MRVRVRARVRVRVPTTEAGERARAVPSTSRVSPVMSDEESRCAWGEGAEGVIGRKGAEGGIRGHKGV